MNYYFEHFLKQDRNALVLDALQNKYVTKNCKYLRSLFAGKIFF